MKKKLLSLLLALCLVMALVPVSAFAAEAPLFGGGTGTQEDPWLITSQEDLISFGRVSKLWQCRKSLILRPQVLETAMAITSSKLLILT